MGDPNSWPNYWLERYKFKKLVEAKPTILEGYIPPDERLVWTAGLNWLKAAPERRSGWYFAFNTPEDVNEYFHGVMPKSLLLSQAIEVARKHGRPGLAILDGKGETVDEYPC